MFIYKGFFIADIYVAMLIGAAPQQYKSICSLFKNMYF